MDVLIERSKQGSASGNVDPAEEMNTVLIAVSIVSVQQSCQHLSLMYTKQEAQAVLGSMPAYICSALTYPYLLLVPVTTEATYLSVQWRTLLTLALVPLPDLL
jgi:hypothetical protein